MPTPVRETFGLFVDVDLPSHPDNYKRYHRRANKGSVYIIDDRAAVQVWLTGSPSSLRLLAQTLTEIAERVEVDYEAAPGSD